MKNLLIACATACTLTFASCVLPAQAPQTIDPTGAVQNTVTRVVERHDAYVTEDPDLTPEARAAALQESSQALFLVALPAVEPGQLGATVVPVLVRHDFYVQRDLNLDAFERSVYLESSKSLYHLYEAALK